MSLWKRKQKLITFANSQRRNISCSFKQRLNRLKSFEFVESTDLATVTKGCDFVTVSNKKKMIIVQMHNKDLYAGEIQAKEENRFVSTINKRIFIMITWSCRRGCLRSIHINYFDIINQ